MPANRTLMAKYKPHAGRTFTLRKNKVIPAYTAGRSSHNEKQFVLNRAEAFGEAVLVLDETNTRICVTTTTGTALWIQKYYLHKEVPSKIRTKTDTMSECVVGILDISRNLRENGLNSITQQQEAVSKLETIAQTLRLLTDQENDLL